jgi:hypothetical protein
MFALASLAGTASATERDDDLALVKRVVAENRGAQEAGATRPAEAPERAERKRAPRWLKVRIAPERGTGEKVSVNVPLALVRLVGDVDVDLGCEDEREHEACGMSVLDLLDELESGQDLVEIDGGDAKIRVWVE